MNNYLKQTVLVLCVMVTFVAYAQQLDKPADGIIREKFIHPKTKLAIWLYHPEKKTSTKIPLVLIPPAGTGLYHGKQISEGDMPEHLPYVRAGFAVLCFEISGHLWKGQTDREVFTSAKKFMDSKVGINDAIDALNLIMNSSPYAKNLNPGEFYVAGHSSAGTLVLQLTQNLPQIKGCIAYAPEVDVVKYLGPNLKVLDKAFPGFKNFFVQALINKTSPIKNVKSIKVPVFLFVAEDDKTISPKAVVDYAAALKGNKVNFTFKKVKTGGHYKSMIKEGIPRGIAWLKYIAEGKKVEPIFNRMPDSAKFCLDIGRLFYLSGKKTFSGYTTYLFFGQRPDLRIQIIHNDLNTCPSKSCKEHIKHLTSKDLKLYKDFKRSKPKKVKINGNKAYRVKWSGKANSLLYKGYLYVIKKGNNLFSIRFQDVSPYSKITMPKFRENMKTFYIK